MRPAVDFLRLSSLWRAALFLPILTGTPLNAGFWGFENARDPFKGVIYAHPMDQFSDAEYRQAVAWILAKVEQESGRSFGPGSFGRAALNVSCNSGYGMQTPHGLVRAVIEELVARGYAREQLFIVDTKANRLRDCGYLPPLSRNNQGPYFDGVKVVGLDDGNMWNDVWFYENPLPVTFSSTVAPEIVRTEEELKEARKSFLAEPLLNDVDFWINLPVVTDHPAMEVNGALSNATLWSVSNRERFFSSPANAPVAMAEIAAIPELLSNMGLTILSLEHYQFIAGPFFNSFYTRSEPEIVGGVDPAIIDAYAGSLINKRREQIGFRPISSPPAATSFAQILGVGYSEVESIQWVRP